MDFTTVSKNLIENEFEVVQFETKEEAADYLDREIDGTEVGIGGSVTLQELGIYEKLSTHNKVNWHLKRPEGKTDSEMRQAANASPVYLSSVNGLAETGEIINIDNICNRVAAIMYGHEVVYLVIGINKLAKDYDEALYRARNIASPLNAKRLGLNTPCAVKADKCYNCKSPDRICRGLSVLWKKPKQGRFVVVLVNEKLGF